MQNKRVPQLRFWLVEGSRGYYVVKAYSRRMAERDCKRHEKWNFVSARLATQDEIDSYISSHGEVGEAD